MKSLTTEAAQDRELKQTDWSGLTPDCFGKSNSYAVQITITTNSIKLKTPLIRKKKTNGLKQWKKDRKIKLNRNFGLSFKRKEKNNFCWPVVVQM